MSDDKPRIVQLEPKPDQIAATIALLGRNLDLLVENQKSLAKIRRAAYLAYLAEGFTEEQALTLCTK